MQYLKRTHLLAFFPAAVLLALLAMPAFAPPTESRPFPAIEWLTPNEHDFGDLLQGKPAHHAFVFRNSGSEPVVIENVRTTCGCTATDWPATPVLPDSTAAIDIEFSARQRGYFYKKIKVYFRGRRQAELLSIEGYVE